MEHFVVDESDGPQVGFGSILALLEDLWGHVEGSAHDGLHHCLLAVEALRESEVAQLAGAVLEEDVGWFEVSVDDAILMQVLGAIHNIPEEPLGLPFAYLLPPLQQFEEIAIVAELSDYVHVIGSLVDIVESYDVVVADLLHDVDLGLDVFDVVGIGEDLLVDHLHRYWVGALDVPSQIDHRVGALS